VASLTIENYVKAIYQICAVRDDRPAATGEIAEALEVLPGTVTSMVKTLDSSGLVTYTPYEGVRLTKSGEALALRVLRRHRLIELFLVETLQLTWDEVHEEAENMEHAVSDRLVDRIEQYLGHPVVDPHGDPIPAADGSVRPPTGQRLTTYPPGRKFRLVRVLDQAPAFLRFLSEVGLSLGGEGEVLDSPAEAEVINLRVGGRDTSLGRDAAEKLLVATPADSAD